MRFGIQIESQDPHESLRPIIDSFPRGCVGQDLLFCKETRESTDLAKCKKKTKKTLFSEPPFLRRAKVCFFFGFRFLSVSYTSKSAIWQFFLVPDSSFRRE